MLANLPNSEDHNGDGPLALINFTADTIHTVEVDFPKCLGVLKESGDDQDGRVIVECVSRNAEDSTILTHWSAVVDVVENRYWLLPLKPDGFIDRDRVLMTNRIQSHLESYTGFTYWEIAELQ